MASPLEITVPPLKDGVQGYACGVPSASSISQLRKAAAGAATGSAS
jgi:hypothetical protein